MCEDTTSTVGRIGREVAGQDIFCGLAGRIALGCGWRLTARKLFPSVRLRLLRSRSAANSNPTVGRGCSLKEFLREDAVAFFS